MNKLTVVAVVFACMPTVAFAQNTREENPFAGLRGEARIGYETPTISGDNEVYKIGSTASYGGEVGFDAAISSKVTVGPYANYEFSSVELCDGGDCLKSDSNFSVGARLSYALSPKAALMSRAAMPASSWRQAAAG
ncbi:MAG: hypothetical protein ACOY45_11745 [Pseudomonadota bacterium]